MADYEYITDTGVIVPDTGETLQEVQDEFKLAFGNNLDVSPETPQGVLITAEVIARDAVVRNNAALANQINPNLAGGIFLDAICALTGLERDKATKTTVIATVAGVDGTVIPEGARASTLNNDVFEATSTVTITGGSVNIPFQSVVDGPVPCAAGALNQVVDGIIGWDSITNASDATLGTNEQSDQSLRNLRKLTLAIQGVGLPEAIISALYVVPNVKSLSFRENITSSTATIDGIELVAHSIYVCVDGGTDLDVATALLNNKSLGANWNGSEEIEVVEPFSDQTYIVKFDRPTPVPIAVRAYVKSNTSLVDPVTATKEAIMLYANGEMEGERGLVVGGPVSSFELAGAVNRLYAGIYVQKLETSDDAGSTWSSNEIPIALDQLATLLISDIEVEVI